MPNATNTSAAPPELPGRVAADSGCGVTAVLIAFVLFGSVDPVLPKWMVRRGRPAVII